MAPAAGCGGVFSCSPSLLVQLCTQAAAKRHPTAPTMCCGGLGRKPAMPQYRGKDSQLLTSYGLVDTPFQDVHIASTQRGRDPWVLHLGHVTPCEMHLFKLQKEPLHGFCNSCRLTEECLGLGKKKTNRL